MFVWWEVLKGFILGAVEGITEFLPVSSTGHMIIVADEILHFTGTKASTFEVFVQLGSILAVMVVFWERILSLFGLKKGNTAFGNLSWLHILIAMMPAVILGLLFHSMIKGLFSPKNVLFSLIAGGILMIVAEKTKPKITSNRLDDVTYTQAFLVGLLQCCALFPGFSRSGATISGGLLAGMERRVAAEFSFILAIPMMFGATSLDLYKNWDILSSADIPLFVTGFVTAFLVALVIIRFFLAIISRVTLTPFAIYRFLLAGILAAYLYLW